VVNSSLLKIYLRIVGFLCSLKFFFGSIEDHLFFSVETCVEGGVLGLGDFVIKLTLGRTNIDTSSFHLGDELGKLGAEVTLLFVFSLFNENVATVYHLILSVFVLLLELSDFGVNGYGESVRECIA